MEGRLAVFLCNLKSSKMRGVLSEGMIMCAKLGNVVEILQPPPGAVPGDRVCCEEYPGKSVCCEEYPGKSVCCEQYHGKSHCCEQYHGKSVCCEQYCGKSVCCEEYSGKSVCCEQYHGKSVCSIYAVSSITVSLSTVRKSPVNILL